MRGSRFFLTGCTLSGLFLLQAAIAHAQFDASDLEGTWHLSTRAGTRQPGTMPATTA